MVVVGIVLIVIGVGLAVAPTTATRAASQFRFLPMAERPTDFDVRGWRIGGLVIAVVGVLLFVLAV